MRLGLFDPLDQQVYAHYGLDKLNTPESRALANKEIAVLAVGINQDIESEGVDRC